VSGQTQFNITGGTRPGGGANLFHSFGNFNVPTNNIANFLNDAPLPTSNIFGRVNGGNVSNIFGTIQTTGFGGANLFLMNPAGFLFGPNATVNVGGMVSFTSADYLRLADGVRFNAMPNATADALLSIAPVAAFGFLGKNPGAIAVQGSQFTVVGTIAELPESADGSGLTFVNGALRNAVDLSLIGGDITIQGGTLAAPGGNVTLVSVGKPSNPQVAGEVSLAGTATGFGTMGTVTLAQGSVIDVSNGLLAPNPAVGSVVIRGGEVVLDTATIHSSNTRAAIAPSVTVESDGSIDIRNGSVVMFTESGRAGTGVFRARTGISLMNSSLLAQSLGSGGSLSLTAPNITVLGGGITAIGDGQGGMIRLIATKAITLADTTLAAHAFFGNAGAILINGGNLFTAQQTFLDVRGLGSGGTIQARANKIILTDTQFAAPGLFSGGGLITLDAKNTTLNNSEFLSTSSNGTGGTITITSPRFRQDASTVIDASSQSGTNGTVTINGVAQPQ
jgi:filamentous hemagglutinin family protein